MASTSLAFVGNGRHVCISCAEVKPFTKFNAIKCKRFFSVRSSHKDDQRPDNDNRKIGLLLEMEGVIADIHKHGHRNCFNLAFKEFGLDCAEWSTHVYSDLLRQSGGKEDLMIKTYFDSIGWPTALPTVEKPLFVSNVLKNKQKCLLEASRNGKIPFRPGLVEFLAETSMSSIPTSVLVGNSKCGEEVARSILSQLSPELSAAVVIVGEEMLASSAYSQVVSLEKSLSSPGDAIASKLQEAVKSEKQRLASEIARELQVSVEMDFFPSEMSKNGVATLRAGAEAIGVPAQDCALLAGSHPGLRFAQAVGMKCIVIRSSITARAEFPLARATVEGFGPGSLTIARLLRLLE